MCLRPNWTYTNKGSIPIKTPVPCRDCWRCRANRTNDYVARCLCEADTSDWTLTLTLTYRDCPERDSDLAHQYITPQHFQEFVRSVRRRGHKIRYLVVGEYGKLRGRAHFHCILFGTGPRPKIPHQKNTNIASWPHGHVFADWNADESALRYVCKYLLKGEPGDYWFSLSKKPALGAAYFEKRAKEYARNGVFPSSFEYLPPGGDRNRPYLLTGASRRDFIRHLLDAFGREGTVKKETLNKWVAEAIGKTLKYEWEQELAALPRDHEVQQFAEEVENRHLTPAQTQRQLVATANIQYQQEDEADGSQRAQETSGTPRPRSGQQYAYGLREWHNPDDFA